MCPKSSGMLSGFEFEALICTRRGRKMLTVGGDTSGANAVCGVAGFFRLEPCLGIDVVYDSGVSFPVLVRLEDVPNVGKGVYFHMHLRLCNPE